MYSINTFVTSVGTYIFLLSDKAREHYTRINLNHFANKSFETFFCVMFKRFFFSFASFNRTKETIEKVISVIAHTLMSVHSDY